MTHTDTKSYTQLHMF